MSKQECLLSSNLNFRASDWMTLNVALNMRIKSGFPVQAIRTLLQSISRILSKKEQTTWFMFQNLLETLTPKLKSRHFEFSHEEAPSYKFIINNWKLCNLKKKELWGWQDLNSRPSSYEFSIYASRPTRQAWDLRWKWVLLIAVAGNSNWK